MNSIAFFQKFAGQNQFRLHIGTTYVAVRETEVVGFATVSATSITIEDLPKSIKKRLPHYPRPALRLVRLAVAEAAQGLGVGKQLLKAVFQIAHEMADRTGCVAVVVDAKPTVIEFYKQYEFEPFETIAGSLSERPSPTPMILPIGSIPRST